MIEPTLIIHGGAGTISQERAVLKMIGMKKAIQEGYKKLIETGNSLDAVEAAIRSMEDDENFNAGYGSVLTIEGDVEMDAVIIRGSDLAAGGVCAVKHIKHPISLARRVMGNSRHALLASIGAERFAQEQGFELVDSNTLISPDSRRLMDSILQKHCTPSTETTGPEGKEGGGGTVGAVAINSRGELAAGTSTGGIACKLPGRVGDSPIPGAGTFCDDNICGLSATGLGEAILKSTLCTRIACDIENGIVMNFIGDHQIEESCMKSLAYMTGKMPEASAGVIAIDKNGRVGWAFNSKQMAWAYMTNNGEIHYGVNSGEHFIDKINEL